MYLLQVNFPPNTRVLSLFSALSREAMGMVLHKDSKWYQQWKDFKDNNVVFNRECWEGAAHSNSSPGRMQIPNSHLVLGGLELVMGGV